MSTADLKKRIPDSRAQRNKPLIEHEASNIMKFIQSQGLYRKGLYLYDPEKWRPLYSITELSWGMCTNPFIAYHVAELLEDNLQDIENPYDWSEMSIVKFMQYTYSTYGFSNKESFSKRGVANWRNSTVVCRALCRYLHFCTTDKVLELYRTPPSFLFYLEERGWEPAKHFLKKFNTITKKINST